MVVIFYHNDNDGKAAAAMVLRKIKDDGIDIKDVCFYDVNYNDKIPTSKFVNDGDIVYIVDYSFTNATITQLEEISKLAYEVYWFDHHKSSLEVLEKAKELCKTVIVDMDRSGAKIVYDEYIKYTNLDNESINWMITLVDDYDRWVKKYPESNLFNLGSSLVPNKPYNGIWCGYDIDTLIENGRIIQKYEQNKNLTLTNMHSYIITINNHECIVLNTPEASSRAFSSLFNKYKFAIRYVFNGINYQYSVYSELEDIDCSKIAKYFDESGGGHKGAAGFGHSELLFEKDDIFNLNLN